MNKNRTYIRWANAEDAADLVILNNAFNGVGITAEEVRDSLASSKELVAMAFMDDTAVGFACAQYFKSFCYRTSQGEITELYISDMARKRGLATLLIAFLEEELKKRGVTSVKVLTGQKNEIAIKTYEGSKYVIQEEVLLQKKL